MMIVQSQIAESRPEVIHLSAKVRILALRLLEKQKKNPEIAKQIGVEVKMKEKNHKKCQNV